VSPQHFDHCDDAYSLSISVQTTLNHIRFVFDHNIKDNERNPSRFVDNTDFKVHPLHYANELLVRVRFPFKYFCSLNMQKKQECLGKE